MVPDTVQLRSDSGHGILKKCSVILDADLYRSIALLYLRSAQTGQFHEQSA